MAEFKLPDVGEGLTEAEIVSWKVKVGDVIEINDIIVEIETAKSLVELPSPYAGTILALMVDEGQMVDVGTPIISVGSEGDVRSGGARARRPRCRDSRGRPLRHGPLQPRRLRWRRGRVAGRSQQGRARPAAPGPPWLARRRPPRPVRRRRCRSRARSPRAAPSPTRSRPSTSRPCRPRPQSRPRSPAPAEALVPAVRAVAQRRTRPGEAARAQAREGPRDRPVDADRLRCQRGDHAG